MGTSPNESIPIDSTLIYNYNVDWWGDGTTSTETANATHTYDTQGIHTVKTTGGKCFYYIYFNSQ